MKLDVVCKPEDLAKILECITDKWSKYHFTVEIEAEEKTDGNL